ncbi:MAG: GAF domain-containing protein [Deltaproteobacteria bacterium]|nr:GAF domain-containing protein [Deltaproteobacteria bacterium]
MGRSKSKGNDDEPRDSKHQESMKNKDNELKKLKEEMKNLKKEMKVLKQQYLFKNHQADLIKQIECVNNKDFSMDLFLDKIMDWINNTTDSTSAALLLRDDSGKNLEFVSAQGPNSKGLLGISMPSTEGIAGKVMSTGKPYNSQDVEKDPIWSPQVSKTTAYLTNNLLAVPLKVKGETKGVIEIINKKNGKPFSKEDISLLQSLSSCVAVAFENAQALAQARGRVKDFKTLSRLSAILNSSLDQKIVRLRAMEAVVELLECETGSLYLIDEETNELYFEVALGEKGDAVKEIRLKMGEGVAGWVAQEGKSDLVPDTAKDPRWASRVDEKSKFQTDNMITVSVKAKDKVIGVLQAINKLGGKKPTAADLRLLENLSDQVAIALENARLYEEQKILFRETAVAMATAIEKRDPYTGGHTKRVCEYCLATAKYLELSPEMVEWLELAAILHDIGKIGVDDHILRKPGQLSDEEYYQMKRHPSHGFEILQHIKQLEPVIPGMKYHHERMDGGGYPNGFPNEDIPLQARIIAVADTWDAMTSDRPYRSGLSDDVAIQELKDFAEIQFDSAVVTAFIKAYENGEILSQHRQKESEDSEISPPNSFAENSTPMLMMNREMSSSRNLTRTSR